MIAPASLWPVFVGDDLSGSAEAVAVLCGITESSPELYLGSSRQHQTSEQHGAQPIAFTDLDSRYADAATIRQRMRCALDQADDRRVVLKIDSLLRGGIAEHVLSLDPARHPVVVAPALPQQGRQVVGGIPLIDNVPLNRSSAVDSWRIVERAAPPATVAAALAPLRVRQVVPGPAGELRRQIVEASRDGRIVVADASSDADLDRLVAASWPITNCRYVGSAGLVSAIARRLGARGATTPAVTADGTLPAGSLIVVGTAESTADNQLQEIHRRGGAVVRLQSGRPLDVGSIADLLERTTVAVSGQTPLALVQTVEQLVATTSKSPRMMLTGGHTARVVLDRLGLTQLRVHGVVHYGAVALDGGDSARVITRPGSFGPADSFVRGAAYLSRWP